MPTKSYATPQDMKDKVGFTDDTTDDTDFQKYIEEAHRTMELRVGTTFHDELTVDELTSDDDVPKTYDLTIRPILSVEHVKVDDKRVDESDYTIDKQLGTITFDASFRDDELYIASVIEVEYVPKVYKDLETWYAIMHMMSSNVIQVDDDQVQAREEEAEKQAAKLENYINRNMVAGTVTDGRVRRGYD